MNEGKITALAAALAMELSVLIGESGGTAGERLIAVAQVCSAATSELVPLADEESILIACRELGVGLDRLGQWMSQHGMGGHA